jgi:ketosteroid isomerase-like protein
MSQENVEVVEHVLAAMSEDDAETAFALVDPDVVIDTTRFVFNPATYVGIEGARQLLAITDEGWEEMRTEPLRFIDAGERVVVIGRLVGKGKDSGVRVERPTGQVWTVRDGLVVRWEIGFTDPNEALKAAGLAE